MRTIARPERAALPSNRVIAAALAVLFILAILPFGWTWDWPKEWVIAPGPPITAAFRWLARDFTIGGVEFSSILRSAAKIVEFPMTMAQSMLAKGFGPLGSAFPALPWFSLLGGRIIFDH